MTVLEHLDTPEFVSRVESRREEEEEETPGVGVVLLRKRVKLTLFLIAPGVLPVTELVSDSGHSGVPWGVLQSVPRSGILHRASRTGQ